MTDSDTEAANIGAEIAIGTLSKAQLRNACFERGLNTSGGKNALAKRLAEARAAEDTLRVASGAASGTSTSDSVSAVAASKGEPDADAFDSAAVESALISWDSARTSLRERFLSEVSSSVPDDRLAELGRVVDRILENAESEVLIGQGEEYRS